MPDPIMPLAPLRLSTITVWPSDSLSLAATSRASMSMVGPGGTGTTIVIGLAAGQACAKAGERGCSDADGERNRGDCATDILHEPFL